MNAPNRKLLAILSLSGATLWVGRAMAPNRKERVMWGVNGQLDHFNNTVERRRERALGYGVREPQYTALGKDKVLDGGVSERSVERERENCRSDYLGHEDAFVFWLARE